MVVATDNQVEGVTLTQMPEVTGLMQDRGIRVYAIYPLFTFKSRERPETVEIRDLANDSGGAFFGIDNTQATQWIVERIDRSEATRLETEATLVRFAEPTVWLAVAAARRRRARGPPPPPFPPRVGGAAVTLHPIGPAWLLLPVAAAVLVLCLLAGRRPGRHVAWGRRALAVVLLTGIALGPGSTMAEGAGVTTDLDVFVLVDRTASMVAEDYGDDATRMDGVKSDLVAVDAGSPGPASPSSATTTTSST